MREKRKLEKVFQEPVRLWRRGLSFALAVLMMLGSFPSGIAAFAEEASSPSELSQPATESQVIGQKATFSGRIVLMSDSGSSSYRPDLRLYADGKDMATPTVADAQEKYLGLAFTTSTYTFSELPVYGADGHKIVYTVTDAGQSGSYALFAVDHATHTLLSADADGRYPAGNTDFIYVERGAISGRAATSKAGTDFSGLILTASPVNPDNLSYTNNQYGKYNCYFHIFS